eukprot:m51a1_g12271 hypothetical protein (200) ;mRNA; f:215703-216436
MGSAASNQAFVRAIYVSHEQRQSMMQEKYPSSKGAVHRSHLVLDELLAVQPPREHPIDLAHLGTLYAVDTDKNGRFEEPEMVEFVKFYVTFRSNERSVDVDAKFQGYCTLRLWNDLAKPSGVDNFVKWIVHLAEENNGLVEFEDRPGERFVSSDSVRAIHRVLNMRAALGVDFQTFFDLMQNYAEDEVRAPKRLLLLTW